MSSKPRILPCRAKGMPSEHNAQTAFLIVLGDVEHGRDLICSYKACRDNGIKFRYCTHCGVPVAKRNFRQRHRHESAAAAAAAVPRAAEIPKTQPVPPLASVAVDSQPPYALPDVSALILGSLASTGAVYPASVSAQQLAAVHSLADRRNENSDDSADDGDKKMAARSSDTERGADMEQEEGIIINSSCTEDSSEEDSSEEEEEEEEEEIRYASGADPRKFDLWMSILESRPSNFESDKLSAWLLQVCELSENPFDPMADEKAARLHNAIQNLSELPDNDNERERS